MSLPQIVSGGDCGPVNPLMGLMKQVGRDTTLQKDRFQQGESSRAGRSAFRNSGQQSRDQQLADEFFANQAAQAHSSALKDAEKAFDFAAMRRELELAHGNPAAVNAAWASEFIQFQRQKIDSRGNGPIMEQRGPEWSEFERIFDRAKQQDIQGHDSDWVNDFHEFQQAHPNIVVAQEERAAFEQAFANAKEASEWESQFVAQESWAAEFTDQQNKDLTLDPDDKSALARTAGMLVETLKEEMDPKFQNSSFLSLMRKLRDEEVAIEGNKMVERIKATCTENDWANEFDESKGINSNSRNWTREFHNQLDGSSSLGQDFNRFQTGESSSLSNEARGAAWAQEFATMNSGPHSDRQRNMAQQADAEATRLGEEFQRNFNPDEDDMQASFAKAYAGIAPFSQRARVIPSAQAREWDTLQNDWDAFAATEVGFRHVGLRPSMYDEYRFAPNNPYVDGQSSKLDSFDGNEILQQEAQVQKDPENARKWYELGCRQQENERESAAISALRKAVELDPSLQEAWMTLAVSYTNENLRADAYDALEWWISHHPNYKDLPGVDGIRVKENSSRQGVDRHELLTNAFLDAVRSRSVENMDPDVQIGLGILFNISEEYEKAIDCFEAGLFARPDDHLLWNKLGATLANSHQPTKAIEAYSEALKLSPRYIRAMYNLAIAKVNINAYEEAVGHLLSALALQMEAGDAATDDVGISRDANSFRTSQQGASGTLSDEIDHSNANKGVTSTSIWDTLRMSLYLLNRPEWAAKCDKRDLEFFRPHFDF